MSLATLITGTVGIFRNRPSFDADRDNRFPDVAEAPPDTRRLIRDRRYCSVLANGDEMSFDDVSHSLAWKAIECEMAIVPGGDVSLHGSTAVATHHSLQLVSDVQELISVESIYIDRNCVTNADYARFVQADGYSNPLHWPEEVLPNVLQFVDGTGHPGPKYWSNGHPPSNKLDHPVVGICWFEANAYATWAGKRLPSTEEWQRAGSWPKGHSGSGSELRYPWGNAFDPSKANTWASGHGETVPVRSFAAGNTPNGVHQLIGNVWEWVDAQFYPHSTSDVTVVLDEAMAEIRGAAFDTYFHSQATCQFRTGQPLLFRGPNVGFRCCISESALPASDCQSSTPTGQ